MNATKRGKLIKKLQDWLNELEGVVQERIEYFDDKSERWQESEKGEAYGCSTESAESAKDAIEVVIGDLETEEQAN